jgi:hypothetical protein
VSYGSAPGACASADGLVFSRSTVREKSAGTSGAPLNSACSARAACRVQRRELVVEREVGLELGDERVADVPLLVDRPLLHPARAIRSARACVAP